MPALSNSQRHTPFARRRATLAALAAITLSAAVALFGAVPAASAHEQVVSSSPAAGEQLAATPDEVAVNFTADIMNIGAVMLLSDEAGTEWELGEVEPQGVTARAAVASELPDGRYTLAWRVVSGDGHPISGVVPFTIGEVAEASAPAPSATGTAAGDDTAGSTVDPTQAPVAASAETGMPQPLRILLLGAGGAALALAAAWLITRWVRRSRN